MAGLRGKQCKPWSDATFCGVRSRSTLFAHSYLSPVPSLRIMTECIIRHLYCPEVLLLTTYWDGIAKKMSNIYSKRKLIYLEIFYQFSKGDNFWSEEFCSQVLESFQKGDCSWREKLLLEALEEKPTLRREINTNTIMSESFPFSWMYIHPLDESKHKTAFFFFKK